MIAPLKIAAGWAPSRPVGPFSWPVGEPTAHDGCAQDDTTPAAGLLRHSTVRGALPGTPGRWLPGRSRARQGEHAPAAARYRSSLLVAVRTRPICAAWSCACAA